MRAFSTFLSFGVLAVSMLACTCSGGTGGIGPAAVGGPTLTRHADDGTMPAAETISTSTPTFYVSWRYPELAAGEAINARLVAVDVGAAAPPGTEVLGASFPITEAGGAAGAFDFSKPTAGWPAGTYRVEVARGAEVFGTVNIAIQ